MASGKTTVGREVGRRLGWDFVDFDEEIERRLGRTISEVFATDGEQAFRAEEARVGSELLGRERAVLASGGGWPAGAGRMDALGPDTFSVWLRVEPATVLTRAGEDGDTRPLLRGEDVQKAVRALLAEREPFYARARLHLDTDRASPEDLADAVLRAVVAHDPL